jgi:hypothetical protein
MINCLNRSDESVSETAEKTIARVLVSLSSIHDELRGFAALFHVINPNEPLDGDELSGFSESLRRVSMRLRKVYDQLDHLR